jgi:hypothetical protein
MPGIRQYYQRYASSQSEDCKASKRDAAYAHFSPWSFAIAGVEYAHVEHLKCVSLVWAPIIVHIRSPRTIPKRDRVASRILNVSSLFRGGEVNVENLRRRQPLKAIPAAPKIGASLNGITKLFQTLPLFKC